MVFIMSDFTRTMDERYEVGKVGGFAAPRPTRLLIPSILPHYLFYKF